MTGFVKSISQNLYLIIVGNVKSKVMPYKIF